MTYRKTVVIVEPFWRGHRPMYLEYISKAFLRNGLHIVVLSPNPEEIKRIVKGESEHVLGYHYVLPAWKKFVLNKYKYALQYNIICYWKHLSNILKEIEKENNLASDFVFVNWLDTYLPYYPLTSIIDSIFKYRWSGIYFELKSYRRKKDLHFTDYALRSKNCRSVCILDEGMASKLAERTGKKIIVFPDFTNNSIEIDETGGWSEILKAQKNKKVITLIGSLDGRKNLLTLLRAAKQIYNKDYTDYFFVVIGKIRTLYGYSKAEIQEMIELVAELQGKNGFFNFQKLEREEEFNLIVAKSDFIYCAYRHFTQSSNLLTKAAAFNKLVIASNKYLLGERVRKYNLGFTIDEKRPAQLVSELIKYADGAYLKSKLEQAKFTDYSQVHSLESLESSIQELINVMDKEKRLIAEI